MRKVVVLPEMYHQIRGVYTDSFFILFDRLCEEYGFEFIFADSLKGIVADLYLIQAGVHGKNLIRESTSLPSDKKVILYLDGFHAFLRSDSMIVSAFDRANYLLGNSFGRVFGKRWPEYVDKFEVFPTFFAPHKRYADLEFNEYPLMRCLLSGNTAKWYFFRNWVAGEVLKGSPQTQRIDIMRHPRWKTPFGDSINIIEGAIHDAYAKALNQYFCSFIGYGKIATPIAKYYEVPATGSLLLAEDSIDVREVGFIADKNYVSVNRENIFKKINYCLNNPEAYREIRLAGMEFVRTNHSVENRVQRIGKILEKL